MVKTYVVAPNFSTAPPPRLSLREDPQTSEDPFSPSVKLQLGDVLVNPFGAEFDVINHRERVKIDTPDVAKFYRVAGYRTSRKELFTGRLGLWASIFAALGTGPAVNISASLERQSEGVLEIPILDTYSFRVTDDYVKKVLRSGAVASYIDEYSPSHLYMVSGIKVAKGASGGMKKEFTAAASSGAGDGSAGAVDAKLLELISKRCKMTSFEKASDFILAVQLRRIKYRQAKPTSTLSTKHGSMADSNTEAEGLQIELERVDDDLTAAKDVLESQDQIVTLRDRHSDECDECIVPLMKGEDGK